MNPDEEEKELTRQQLESMSDRQLIVHVALEQNGMKKQLSTIHGRVRALENLRTYAKGVVGAVTAAAGGVALYLKMKTGHGG